MTMVMSGCRHRKPVIRRERRWRSRARAWRDV